MNMEQHYITKSELAQSVLPDIEVRSAVNRLMIWIKRNPELTQELSVMGYRKKQKYLSPKMVELIKSRLVF